jgi:hypothetical protein
LFINHSPRLVSPDNRYFLLYHVFKGSYPLFVFPVPVAGFPCLYRFC